MSNRQPNGIAAAAFIAAAIAFLIASSISPAFAGPVATFSRLSIDFDAVSSGFTSFVQPVFVTNTGDAPLTISGGVIEGANASDFSVAGTCTPPLSLPPNGRCRLDFTLSGTGIGTRQATFSLQSNLPSPPSAIALSGLLGQQGSTVARTADWIDFPATPPGGSAAPQSITFHNNEDFLVFDITGIDLMGGNRSDFTLSSTCVAGSKLLSGSSCTATIGFLPTAPGPRSTELQFDFFFIHPKRYTFSVTGVGGPAGPSPTLTVVEYRNAAFDHYFVTPVGAEITLLDAHAPPFQDWSRTGFSFNVYANATAPAASVAICRFFNDTFAPKSSHFYGPRGGSCDATIAKFPGWKLEDDKLFNAMLSDLTGACPAGTIPVYRLFNNGVGGAPNHRFVTSLAERQKMVNQGWTPEGNGIGVETCVPP